MTKKKKEQIVNTPAPAVAVKQNKPKYKQASKQNKNQKTVLNNTKELEKQAREKYVNLNKQKLEEQEPNLGPIDLRLKLKEQWSALTHEEQQKYRDMVVRIAAPEQAKAKAKPLRAFQFYDAEHDNDEELKGLSQSEKRRKLSVQWQALSGKEQAKYFKMEIEAVKEEKRKQGLSRKYKFDLLQAKKSPKAFALYRQKKIERLKKKFPELSEGEVGHKLKEQWEAEKQEVKQKYLDDAKELKNQLKQLQEKRTEQYSGVKRKREESDKNPLINLSSNVPLKAPKAFSLYKFDKFEMVKKENPKADSKDVHQKIKDEWKKETPAVKEKYMVRSRNIKQQLSSDMNHLLKQRRQQNEKARERRVKIKERAKQKWQKIKEKSKERKQRKLEQTIDDMANK